jgi:hypothetical protein
MICHPERSEGSWICISVRDSSLRYALPKGRLTVRSESQLLHENLLESV